MFEKITIEEIHGLFLVRSGDRFADHLTKDEVLGVIASALFSPSGPIFVRTYEQEVAVKFTPAGRAYLQGPKLALPPPRNIDEEFEYHKQRADANWRALCECRGEDSMQGDMLIGNSVERGGWCVYSQNNYGEYDMLHGPYGSRLEAEAAMERLVG